MSTSEMKKGLRLIGLTLAALLLAVVENRWLWGYWLSRPGLASEFAGIDRLLAVSVLESDLSTGLVSKKPRPAGIVAAEQPCRARTNECLEGNLLVRLAPQWPITEQTPEVGDELIRRAWTRLTTDSPIRIEDPEYQRTSKPVAGLAIHYAKGDQVSLLVAHRTSEIANDRYAYVETLYRVNGGSLALARQKHFFFEVAGLEGIRWPILWPVNFVVLLLLSFLAARVTRKRGPIAATAQT